MGSGPSAHTNLGSSKQRGWRFWAAVIVAILATIFIFQNIQSVEVNVLFASTETPLVFALLIVFLLGAVIGWLAPRLRRDKQGDRQG